MTPTFLSLFAGIGGIDLGLERAGFKCVGQVEWDDFCQEVLTKHWPDVPKFQDIKDITDEQLRSLGHIDVVVGGFPCQPVSVAGRQKAQTDERWLWPEFARVIRTVQPRVVFVENVPGLLTANAGEAFGEVQVDLAEMGYDTEWACIPASAFGAPHLRKRIALIAWRSDTYSDGRQGLEELDGEPFAVKQASQLGHDTDGFRDAVSDPVSVLLREQSRRGDDGSTQLVAGAQRTGRRAAGSTGPREAQGWRAFSDSPGCGFRRREIWATEPNVGRVAYGVPKRMDRLKSLGNAVVPQFAEYVGHCIMRRFFA